MNPWYVLLSGLVTAAYTLAACSYSWADGVIERGRELRKQFEKDL